MFNRCHWRCLSARDMRSLSTHTLKTNWCHASTCWPTSYAASTAGALPLQLDCHICNTLVIVMSVNAVEVLPSCFDLCRCGHWYSWMMPATKFGFTINASFCISVSNEDVQLLSTTFQEFALIAPNRTWQTYYSPPHSRSNRLSADCNPMATRFQPGTLSATWFQSLVSPQS